MSRWQPDARERLEQAALELFTTQGFAATTVPEIATRAGLTTRTFFRHFADKREVLFAGDEIPDLARRLIAEAPAGLAPADLILAGLRIVADTRFEGRRTEVRQVRGIIRTDAGLLERDLLKRAALCAAIHAGLIDRGAEDPAATVLAEMSVALLQVSLERWVDHDDDRTLFATVLDTLDSMKAVADSFPDRAAP